MRYLFPGLTCVVALLAGCSSDTQPEKRLSPGAVVAPLVNSPKTWEAGKPIPLTAKLRLKSPQSEDLKLLVHEEVLDTHPPRISVTFLKDSEVVKVYENVDMKPDC